MKFLPWYKFKGDTKKFEKQTVTEIDEIRPKDYNEWYNQGISLSKLVKYDEAVKSYDKAIEIKPNYQVAKDNQEIVRKKLTKS